MPITSAAPPPGRRAGPRAAAALLLLAAPAAARADEVIELQLELAEVDPDAAWARLPFEVPAGVAELELRRVSATEGVVVDLGLLEPDGGLRGWSGGNTEPAVVGAEAASRSYRAGPLPAGAWAALVGLPGLPAGPVSVRLEVELRGAPTLAAEPGRAPYAPPAPLREGREWVAGDFHVHSRESGDADPAADLDAVAAAAKAAGLDFVLLSEHNTAAHLQLLAAAQARHPDLLFLPGVEWTSHRGHALVPGATSPPPFWVGLDGLRAEDAAAAAAAQGALFAPAHPALDLGALCLGCAWTHALPPEAIDALEVATLDVELVGTFLFDGAVGLWDELEDQGRHVVPLGGSDDHAAGAGEGPFSSPVGRPRTLVEVDALSVEGLLAGLRAGRTVVQLGGEGDPMLILDAPGRVGDTVDGAAATATVEVQGGAGGELQWWVDGALARTDPVDADPWTGALDLAAPAAGETRVRALLVRGGLPRTVTSHLYLRRGADSGAGAGGEADGAAKAGGCGCGGGGAAAGLMGLVAALLAALRRRPAPR